MRKLLTRTFLAVLAVLMLTAGSCEGDNGSAQSTERNAQASNYERLVAAQPTQQMSYSPTRETINFWLDTWDEPGKLSFVYLMAANGQFVGYFVLEGLPVSYCASQTPTFQEFDLGNTSADLLAPAPAMDGVYYSGGQCNQYYGRDATTGAFMELSIGGSLNYMLFDEPLPIQVEPLGFTTISDLDG